MRGLYAVKELSAIGFYRLLIIMLQSSTSAQMILFAVVFMNTGPGTYYWAADVFVFYLYHAVARICIISHQTHCCLTDRF